MPSRSSMGGPLVGQGRGEEARETEIEALNIQSERASRKKSGLRLDDDLTEMLKENRLDGVADLLRKSRVSSVAMERGMSMTGWLVRKTAARSNGRSGDSVSP